MGEALMTAGAQEIELKFFCTPQDLPAVLAAAPAGDDESRDLISVYFDTPAEDLRKAGASLRVRESKGRRVQTLKRGAGFSREEHEKIIVGRRPELDVGPLRDLLPAEGFEALKPAFNVRVTRRQRVVQFAGAEIELALDQGKVAHGRRSQAICEVELELIQGEPAALFALARHLGEAAPLYLSFDSKSDRGAALAEGRTGPRKVKLELSPHATAGEGFQAAARAALGQIASSAARLRTAPDADAVHRLRVGARRLRSLLSTFAPIVRDGELESVKREIKWLAWASNAARNLDVYAERIAEAAEGLQPPRGLAALRTAVSSAQRQARADFVAAVSSQRFRLLMIDALAWVETGAWAAHAEAHVPAKTFAELALDGRRKKLRKRGEDFATADDPARHQVRIEAKKLRYAAESLASLYPPKAVRRFIRKLQHLQELLGELNDIATAEAVVAGLELRPRAAFAAGELAGARAVRKPYLILDARAALKGLEKARPFWRR